MPDPFTRTSWYAQGRPADEAEDALVERLVGLLHRGPLTLPELAEGLGKATPQERQRARSVERKTKDGTAGLIRGVPYLIRRARVQGHGINADPGPWWMTSGHDQARPSQGHYITPRTRYRLTLCAWCAEGGCRFAKEVS